VLGGHSHKRLNGVVDGTPVIISGSHGTTLGRIDFVIDRAAMKPIASETRRQLLTVFADEPAPDSTIAAYVDSVNSHLLPMTSRVLGRSKDALTRNRQGESSLGDWVADAMRAASGADFAFQNPGGLRADLDAGDVTMGDVYEVMPFDNQIATVTLSGAQVLDLVEHGVSPPAACNCRECRSCTTRIGRAANGCSRSSCPAASGSTRGRSTRSRPTTSWRRAATAST
jgi:5'-nucleotidase